MYNMYNNACIRRYSNKMTRVDGKTVLGNLLHRFELLLQPSAGCYRPFVYVVPFLLFYNFFLLSFIVIIQY